MSWLQIKKNLFFEVSSSLILCNNNEPFLNRWLFATKSGFLCDSQLSEWTENQRQTCTVHGHWWLAPSLIHYSSLNPGETITSEKYAQQIDEMHRKLQRLQPALVNRKGLNLHNARCITNTSKVEQTGLWSIASSAIFNWPLSIRLPLLQASQ